MKRALTWLILGVLIASITDLQVSAQTDQKKTKPKVGLVLSGGGAKGFAHVGVLKAIDEAGIQIDYVGGTSIGSIIGAMYAAGYKPEEMDSMIRTQNWTQLIQDKFPRAKLSIQEKGLDEQFFVSFPIKKKEGISLPQSVVQGQEVMNLLEQLFLPVFKTRDFDDLEIPFLCIGTDLLTGNAITLDTGNLAHAVRASMSIPSYFAPTEYGEYFLVDGGVVDNYPVMNVIDMGADIIIGVDVQSPPKTIEELNTVVSVITQIVEYHAKPAGDIARAHTNVSINPDISGYDMMSFTSYDSLLARGYAAGRKALPELQALKKRLDKYDESPTERKKLDPIDSLYITDVRFEGLVWLNENFMDGQIKFDWPAWMQTSQLDQLISDLLSTRFFQSLRYDILPVEGGNVLVFHIKEASAKTLSFGIHYDSYYQASINLLGTFRNWIIDGSKMTAALSLGTNPLIIGDYFVNRGYRPGPGISIAGEVIDVNIYEKGLTTEIKRFSTAEFELYAKSTIQSVMELGIGTSIEYTNHSTKVGLIPDEGTGQFYTNAEFFLNLDTYNHLNFPTKGWQTEINSEYIYGIKEDSTLQTSVFFQRVTIRRAFPLNKRLTVIGIADVGFSIGSTLPTQNRFYFGGFETRSLNGLTSFMGADYLEHGGNHMYVGKANLQWDIHARKHFATLSINVGDINNTFENLFDGSTLLVGYGLTYSYNSLIGPLSFTLMTSNKDPILGMINLGFRI